MKKLFFKILISLILLMSFPVFMSVGATTVNVSSAVSVDVNAQIRGRAVAYTLDVPPAWRRHVSVVSDLFLNPVSIVERLVFSYRPANPTTASAVLLEIVVFIRDEWRENLGYIRLTETDDHVFAIRAAASNPFVFGADRLMFDNFLRDASNPAFLINYMSVPVRGESVVRNTVSVNGKRMNSPSITSPQRVVSVPLRETAEALGYTVAWDETSGNISLSSGTFFTTLGRDINLARRHNITNVNGLSYVSTMFFLQTLQCNVEIDEHSNVRITREERD